MNGFISAISNGTTGLTAATFYDVLTEMVPFLVVIIPVALGFYLIRKLIKGTSKAKVRF